MDEFEGRIANQQFWFGVAVNDAVADEKEFVVIVVAPAVDAVMVAVIVPEETQTNESEPFHSWHHARLSWRWGRRARIWDRSSLLVPWE